MSKAPCLLFLILSAHYACFCQTIPQRRVDTLLTQLQTFPPDTNQLNTLHQLGRYYLERRFRRNGPDLDSALFFFNRANNLSNRLNVDKGSGRLESLRWLGQVYLSKNKFEEGKACFAQVWDYYQKNGDKKMEAKTRSMFAKTLSISPLTNPPGDIMQQITGSYKTALALFVEIGDSQDELLTCYYLANAYFGRGYYDEAEAVCIPAVKKYQNSSFSNIEAVYFVLAGIHRYRGNLNKALFYILEAIKRIDKVPDAKSRAAKQSAMFGELALIYDALGQTENSIIWYKKTLAIREDMNMPLEYKYRTAGFIVQGLIKQKKIAEALNIALGMEKRHPADNDYDKAMITQVKAYCYDALKDYKKAEALYIETLRLYGDGKTDEIVSLAKYDVARFYISRKRFDKAAFYLDEEMGNASSISRKKDYQLIRYKIDSAKGNYASALQHHIQYKIFNDSIFNADKNKQIQQLQVQFETAQKERDIKSLKKDSQLQHEKAIRANNTRNLTLAISALLIFLTGLIYNGYRAKKRSNVALNELVNDKDKLLAEKEWLLKEIHHRVKNNLQIVMGLLQRQSSYINNEEALTAIQNSKNRMHSIALIHQKLYQSENLDLINMREYIDELISYLKDTADLENRVAFLKEIDTIDLDVAQAVPLGLLLNEAITNAIKYAYPGETPGLIRVTMKMNEDGLNTLTVADDGPGLSDDFDPGKANSLGMNLMRGLAKQLGGKLEIINNGGLTIRISFKKEKFNSVLKSSGITLN